MKKMKRFSRRGLALLLALIMCLGSMQITAFADEPDSGIVTDDSAGSTIADDSNDDTNVDDSNDDANVDDSNDDTNVDDSSDDTNVDDGNDDTNADNSNDDTNTDDSDDGTDADNSNGDTNTDNANAGNSNDGADNSNGNANVENSNNGELPPVENDPTTAGYATLEELEAAFMAVGAALESGDIQSGIDALDNYLAIYNRLSPEDQAANAEAKAAALAYRDTLIAAQNAQENDDEAFSDPDINTLAYTTYKSTITFYPGDGSPTGVKMSVGDHYEGNWYVKSISTSEVTFGSKYGEHNNNFTIPAPEAIWKGVSHDYKTVAAYSTAFNGDKPVGSSALLIYTGGHATFKNVINVPSGTTDNGPYITVVHKYYTNGKLDGTTTDEKVSVSGSYAYATDYYKATYDGNTYPNKGYDKYLISISSSSGSQGTFTLTYNRTVATSKYSYQLTWDYNGGNVGGDSSRTNKVENIEKSTYTFYEDAEGYGSPKPTREGYEFTGWKYTGNGSFNNSNGQINMTGEAGKTVSGTLKAQWNLVNTDNGAGISITKTRVSINGDANATTAEPGDTIEWNITVKNNSNVTKTVTLTEKLTGASLSENKFTLAAGKSKTVTATYTVKNADKGKTICNTVVGETEKNEEAEGKDGGTPVDPGTTEGSFTVTKSFVGLDEDGPEVVTLTYSAYRTKDGTMVGSPESGKITLTKQNNYMDTITPTVWDMTEYNASYKNVVEIIEEPGAAEVKGYNHSGFGPLYGADATVSGSTVKFVMPGATYEKKLAVKNTYDKIEEPPVPKITVTWLDGYSDKYIKQAQDITKPENSPKTKDEVEALHVTYPNDPTREGYYFTKWGDPVTDKDGNITITAEWKELTYKVEWYVVGEDQPFETATREGKRVGDTVEVTEKDKTRENYTYKGDNYKENNLSDKLAKEGTVLKLYFTKNPVKPSEADYTVEWYIVGTDDPVKTATRTGAIGEKVEVSDEDKSYDGYDFVEDHKDNVLSIDELPENGGVLKLYFDRKAVSYTVVHEYYTNGSPTGSIQISNSGKVGEIVNAADIGKIGSYGGNDYTYGEASAESITLTESGRNIITLRYYRTTSDRRDPEPTPTPPRRNPDPTTEPDPDPSTDPAPNPTAAPSPIPSLVPGVPTVDILETNVPLTNLPDEDVPLAGTPKKAEGLEVDIFDEEVPLSDVPKTGDISDLWYLAALLSAGMLIFLGLRRKNHR